MNFEHILQCAAVIQIGIAVLNLFLVRILGWSEELNRMPQLLREVFKVHTWFISLTLLIFGVITWRFAPEMAGGIESMGRWLAAGIGLFWALRTVLQVAYYSSSHWRGRLGRTAIHLALLLLYGALAAVYLQTAFPRLTG